MNGPQAVGSKALSSDVLLVPGLAMAGAQVGAFPVGRRATKAPGILGAIGLEVLFYLGVVLAALALTPFQELDDPTRFLLIMLPTWAVMLVLARRLGRDPWGEVFPMKPFPASILPGVALASLGVLLVGAEMASWIPVPDSMEEVFREQIVRRYHWAQIASMVLVAPFAEEFFYRGFVLRGFLSRYSAWIAVLASAGLFAAAHLNPWQGMLALPMGVLSAWLFIETGSLWPCVISHAIVNATHLPVMAAYDLAGVDVEQWEEEGSSPLLLLIGLSLAAIGVLLLRRRFTAIESLSEQESAS